MFNEKDILTRLQNGEKVDDIAQEVIGLVNKANETYEAEVEAKRKREVALKARKERDFKVVAEQFCSYVKTYYPHFSNMIDEFLKSADYADIVKSLDKTINSMNSLNTLFETVSADLKTPKKDTKDYNKILDDFLNEMGW